MWNTPPTFNIYTTGKVMDWMIAEGGIDEMESRAIRKSNAVMDVVDESGGFYNTPCQVKADRSRMNVPFDVCGGDEKATEAFLIGELRTEVLVALRRTLALQTIDRSPLAARHLPLATRRSLFVTHRSPLTAHRSPPSRRCVRAQHGWVPHQDAIRLWKIPPRFVLHGYERRAG